jgi:hypothetical protein
MYYVRVYLCMYVLCTYECVSMYVVCKYVYPCMYLLYTYVFMHGCVGTYEGNNFKNLDARILLKDMHVLENLG